MLDFQKITSDFPILRREINGKKLIYLDNAATSQKPLEVIKAISNYYEKYNANIHRGIHTLSNEATSAYENVRKKTAEFINAKSEKEIIFTSGTTMSLNLVANSWGRKNLKRGDVVLLTEMEHHSNLIPWQLLAEEIGFEIKYIPFDNEGRLKLPILNSQLSKGVKLLSLVHVSNTLGTVNPIEEAVKSAKKNGTLVCVDGAQAAPHMKVDVQKLGCDFYAFSGHKMLGPTGVGVLWVREEPLRQMTPFLGGGEMIREVYLNKRAIFNKYPHKFEAGTPNIAGVIGLGKAIDYLEEIGMENIRKHGEGVIRYAIENLSNIKKLKMYGPKDPKDRSGLVAFVIKGIHAHDLAAILDEEGIAVRSGHHCTMPLHNKLRVPATTRASFYLYNTKKDVEALIHGIKKAKEIFRI